jgi:hypothetical protein
VSLVERNGRAGHSKWRTSTATLHGVLRDNASAKSRLMTDEGMAHNFEFASHEKVHHGSGEYARGDMTTNTVEGFFGVFKRGMRGTYQHCGAQHLQLYLDGFDFRYSNRTKLGVHDPERAALAVKGAAGKRLTYRHSFSGISMYGQSVTYAG